jgi:hypothetical protein
MLFVAGVSLMFRMPDRMPLTEESVPVGQGLLVPRAASSAALGALSTVRRRAHCR